MIEGKNFGIHISGIRDGHSPHIFSTQGNSKEFDDIFMDIRTGVNKIDQSHFFKVHQTTNYSVASLVTTGFRDRGGRPGAYITVSLFTKRGMMFSTSPRKKLIELLSFYKLKQGNNFESNQFTSNGLLEVIGDLPVEHNKMKATPQKVSGFALYQDETHIDKYLKFNGGALAYGHYYFLPIAAKEKMTSFKSEISNLFGFEGNNSRLNDLYKAAPKPPISTGGPGRQGTSGGSGNPGTSGGSGRPGTSGGSGKPGTTGGSGKPGKTGGSGQTGSSGGSGKSGTTGGSGITGGSGLPESTGSSKNSKNWNKMLIPVLGIAIIGFSIWLIMTFMGGDDTTSISPAPPAKPKTAATDTVKGTEDEPVVNNALDKRVDSLMKGVLVCRDVNKLRSGPAKNVRIINQHLFYTQRKWYYDHSKLKKTATDTWDNKITTQATIVELNKLYAKEVKKIDEIEASSNGGGTDDGGRGTGGDNGGDNGGSGDGGAGGGGSGDGGRGSGDGEETSKMILESYLADQKKKADNLKNNWKLMESECKNLATQDERSKCFDEKKAELKSQINNFKNESIDILKGEYNKLKNHTAVKWLIRNTKINF
ncbi:collagen-like protein [bacterium]|nr:collagen-like protein [bacterium]